MNEINNLYDAVIAGLTLKTRSEKRKAEALKKIADNPIDYTPIEETLNKLYETMQATI